MFEGGANGKEQTVASLLSKSTNENPRNQLQTNVAGDRCVLLQFDPSLLSEKCPINAD